MSMEYIFKAHLVKKIHKGKKAIMYNHYIHTIEMFFR